MIYPPGAIKCIPLGTCHVCGGEVAFTEDRDGRANGLVHKEPHCHAFRDLDVTTFASQMRAARGLPDPMKAGKA